MVEQKCFQPEAFTTTLSTSKHIDDCKEDAWIYFPFASVAAGGVLLGALISASLVSALHSRVALAVEALVHACFGVAVALHGLNVANGSWCIGEINKDASEASIKDAREDCVQAIEDRFLSAAVLPLVAPVLYVVAVKLLVPMCLCGRLVELELPKKAYTRFMLVCAAGMSLGAIFVAWSNYYSFNCIRNLDPDSGIDQERDCRLGALALSGSGMACMCLTAVYAIFLVFCQFSHNSTWGAARLAKAQFWSLLVAFVVYFLFAAIRTSEDRCLKLASDRTDLLERANDREDCQDTRHDEQETLGVVALCLSVLLLIATYCFARTRDKKPGRKLTHLDVDSSLKENLLDNPELASP